MYSDMSSRASYIRSQSTNPSGKEVRIVGRKINTNMNLAKRYNIPNSHLTKSFQNNANL